MTFTSDNLAELSVLLQGAEVATAEPAEPVEQPRPRFHLPETGTYRRAYLDLHWVADLFSGLPLARDLGADALQQITDTINDHVTAMHGLYQRLLNDPR